MGSQRPTQVGCLELCPWYIPRLYTIDFRDAEPRSKGPVCLDGEGFVCKARFELLEIELGTASTNSLNSKV